MVDVPTASISVQIQLADSAQSVLARQQSLKHRDCDPVTPGRLCDPGAFPLLGRSVGSENPRVLGMAWPTVRMRPAGELADWLHLAATAAAEFGDGIPPRLSLLPRRLAAALIRAIDRALARTYVMFKLSAADSASAGSRSHGRPAKIRRYT